MRQHDDNNDNTLSHHCISSETIVYNYRVLGRLGAGGMGEVYLAEDTKLRRKVALKFLPPQVSADREMHARMYREAQAAAALNHPRIVTVHEINEFQGSPFIAMEYIKGAQLGSYCKSHELSTHGKLALAIQILEGLVAAHAAGIVHRDIKPSNIIIDDAGNAKILDFGLATIQGLEKLTLRARLPGPSATCRLSKHSASR